MFEHETVDEVVSRMDGLLPASQRKRGKMDVAQMRAHCSITMDIASGRENLPRIFLQRKVKVRQFYEGGESRCTRHPHPFFGPLTPQAWSRGMYQHLARHLQQVGV